MCQDVRIFVTEDGDTLAVEKLRVILLLHLRILSFGWVDLWKSESLTSPAAIISMEQREGPCSAAAVAGLRSALIGLVSITLFSTPKSLESKIKFNSPNTNPRRVVTGLMAAVDYLHDLRKPTVTRWNTSTCSKLSVLDLTQIGVRIHTMLAPGSVARAVPETHVWDTLLRLSSEQHSRDQHTLPCLYKLVKTRNTTPHLDPLQAYSACL